LLEAILGRCETVWENATRPCRSFGGQTPAWQIAEADIRKRDIQNLHIRLEKAVRQDAAYSAESEGCMTAIKLRHTSFSPVISCQQQCQELRTSGMRVQKDKAIAAVSSGCRRAHLAIHGNDGRGITSGGIPMQLANVPVFRTTSNNAFPSTFHGSPLPSVVCVLYL
jgi:hypothetical protein